MKLTLYEINVLEVNETEINANLVEKDFRIMECRAKERVTFQN